MSVEHNKWLHINEAIILCENAINKGYHLGIKDDDRNQDVEKFLQEKTSGSWLLDMNGIAYFLK